MHVLKADAAMSQRCAWPGLQAGIALSWEYDESRQLKVVVAGRRGDGLHGPDVL